MNFTHRIIYRLIKLIKIIIRNGLIVLNDGLICLPVKKNYYLFESFNGKDVSDNPAAIYKQLVHDDPSTRDRAYFGVKPGMYKELHEKYPNVHLLKRFMPKWIYCTARAQFWIFNSRMPTWWRKNKGTVYIQTWHGTPLKKLGLDMKQVEMPGTSTKRYKKHFKKETQRWDYLIAPNLYSEKIFKSAFAFKNRFLKIGYPRNDVLYRDDRPEVIKRLKKSLLGRSDVHVITYAPTWRDDDYITRGAYRFELKFSLKEFFKHVPKDTILIIRPHYLIKSKIDVGKFKDRVKVMRDVDISKLYLISDLLITDYSSVMFDYANLNRPMLFFSYDLAHYRNTLRGFYFDYQKDIPGPLATTADQLYKDLDVYTKHHGFPEYAEKMKQFRHKYCTWESADSSEKVVQLLKKVGK
ncbi:CDP-glycerol glycerophosphotransferase family protein [Acetilactobacillus jinshanensis]|uniref:CDP-glycerol glycerophosphotransferase family protein n=1 Tax=Acetilactobacillus jinshanensis TaxID=1720083 RepID=A0A4P6ZK08_9LACO|nr:CDP-glycerol glycerophosphotransferase family protein [Acetilactobacillus jinshanensis]QBP17978.1 CDP-glycerol glycerophosphotransferase family protein [Acetilactobacillus jinshanensis]URL60840.1 CDP-glycerol glycerophosphotransferase family protein [uncultured bacterium]